MEGEGVQGEGGVVSFLGLGSTLADGREGKGWTNDRQVVGGFCWGAEDVMGQS